jgi:hypothetical protein
MTRRRTNSPVARQPAGRSGSRQVGMPNGIISIPDPHGSAPKRVQYITHSLRNGYTLAWPGAGGTPVCTKLSHPLTKRARCA